MRPNNVIARALSAVLVAVLLNGSVICAFAHLADAHDANAATEARAWA